MVSLSMIIRCKNEEPYIGKTLEQIFSQRIDVPYEVIIVDSGSTDRTLEIARGYAVNILRIPPESFTFGYALNYGIQRAQGTIIVNLSAHCVPTDERWLKELVAPIMISKASATFGRQVAVKGVNAFEEVSLDKHFPEHAGIKDGRVPFSNSNCAFLKKLWIEQKFDEELSSWEDYLWYYLLKDRYIFQYCPKGAVYHTHAFSLKAIEKRAYIDGKAFKLIRKKYNIDFLEGICHTLRSKINILFNDIKFHVTIFGKEGYIKYIFVVPIVRFLAYRAYWNGYNSIK
jgi:rhamnosyltransferase